MGPEFSRFRPSHREDAQAHLRLSALRTGLPRCVSCLARQRNRNCHLAPALLLGRSRQGLNSFAFRSADLGLEIVRADRLWVRAPGPERLEPISPLSSRLVCGTHGFALPHLQSTYRVFPEKPLRPAAISPGERSPEYANHLRFKRPSEAEA